MKIKVYSVDGLLDGCETEEDEEKVEKFVEGYRELAKNNSDIVFDDDYIFTRNDFKLQAPNDLKELLSDDVLDFSCNNFSEVLDWYNQSDWYDLADGIDIKKEQCIDLVYKKIINEDETTIKLVDKLFSNAEYEDIAITLINSQVKYVILEKINMLNKLIVEDVEPIWK